VAPDIYLPINSRLKPYLKEVLNIDPSFKTWHDYIRIITQVREKSNDPFYKISHQCWVWSSSKVNYWVFQGNPEIYDIKGSLRDNALNSWSVSAHKKEIKIGDKIILWKVGENSGCYALCRVVSEIRNRVDDEIEQKYYIDPSKLEPTDRVSIDVDVNLWDKPILKDQLIGIPEFENFKAGRQGTNLSATKEQYNKLFEMANNMGNKKYWLYAPGSNAKYWEEFYNAGIMAIGWEKLGDLKQYPNREDITRKLQEIEATDSSKKNDATTNFDFRDTMQVGDIVIVKKGKKEYLGYGIVASDYYYDSSRDYFRKCRKVDWVKKGVWVEENKEIVLKTLTDITKYPNYVDRLSKLIGIELSDLISIPYNDTSPLNTIMFGPPGTGKTYNALPLALNIINGFELKDSYSKEEWSILKKQFDELREEGRIEFVTFHQSMSYEDFVEGIKPKMDETSTEKGEIQEQLHYEISDGVFKRIADRAAATEKISQHSENYKMPDTILSEIDDVGFGKIRFENWVPGNEVYEYCMENNVICVPYEVDLDFSDSKSEAQTEKLLTDNNYGWHEKVGIKTIKHWFNKKDIVFITSVGKNNVKAVAQVTGDYFYNPDSSISFSHFRKVKWLMKDVNIPVDSIYSTQFSSYAASLLYRARVRKDFFKKQDKRENLKYVLIIDEINRGNIANIFGELITLLEPSKRVGESEHLKIKLPYSKNDFEVSSNLYLIGTMNTADRSVEALDTALRRRFSFREMVPKPELIKTAGALRKTDGKIGDIDVVKLLETINKRLEKLIDKDHRIGHSYFMHIKTETELQLAFKDKVIPLLEEYFFGDFGKIGLVLGSSFVEKLKDNAVFASFDDYGDAKQDLAERPVYKIKDPGDWDFISIYQ